MEYSYSKEELLKMYGHMIDGRIFNEQLLFIIKTRNIHVDAHSSLGQEAISVGTALALGKNDFWYATHRCMPGQIIKYDAKTFVAEMLSKKAGYTRGKGGDYHLSDMSAGMLPGIGILGVGAPTFTGFAWALKHNKKDSVVVIHTGDGASSQGNVYEAYNLAMIYKVPVVFVIENNGWGEATPVNKISPLENLSDRAKAFNMTGITIDGNDVLEVRKTVEEAIERAKKGSPTLIEMKTIRWEGHFIGEPQEYYRNMEEVEEGKRRCPVKKLENYLKENNLITEAEVVSIKEKSLVKIKEWFEYGIGLEYATKEETLEFDTVWSKGIGGEI